VRLPLKWCKKKASTHQNRLMTGHKLHLILIGNELHEEDNIQVYNQLAERERERDRDSDRSQTTLISETVKCI
jgi:hypothetical protein